MKVRIIRIPEKTPLEKIESIGEAIKIRERMKNKGGVVSKEMREKSLNILERLESEYSI